MRKATYMGIEYKKDSLEQRVFHCFPPLDGYEYVKVSSNTFDNMFIMDCIAETFIFGCTPGGKVLDWQELTGFFKGKANHALALANAGYEIVSELEKTR